MVSGWRDWSLRTRLTVLNSIANLVSALVLFGIALAVIGARTDEYVRGQLVGAARAGDPRRVHVRRVAQRLHPVEDHGRPVGHAGHGRGLAVGGQGLGDSDPAPAARDQHADDGVLVAVPGEQHGVVYGRHETWDGPRIAALPQVLDLLD